jgi:hypothetical protein
MKKLLLSIVIFLTVSIAFAQDVITLKTGTDIQAIVQEVGIDEIKYKKFDNPNGPNYILQKSEVFRITYANGSRDVFNDATVAPVHIAAQQQTTTAISQQQATATAAQQTENAVQQQAAAILPPQTVANSPASAATLATPVATTNVQNASTVTANSQQIVLTIEKIVMSNLSRIGEIHFIDEKGDKFVFLFAKVDEWFENATLADIASPQGFSVTIDGIGNYWIADGTKLGFEFKVGETIYPIGVWNGSKLMVQKMSDDKYILLPEESAKLSPPPVPEPETSSVTTTTVQQQTATNPPASAATPATSVATTNAQPAITAQSTGAIAANSQTTMQISLLEAVSKELVRFSAHGNNIESSTIRIENVSDMKLHLIIPAGTYLSANSNSYQNMILTSPRDIVVDAGRTYSGRVNTACMNMYRDIPGSSNTFGIAQHADNHLLTKVIKRLNEGNYKFSIIQAAVWIVTDNASSSGVSILQNQNRQRIISSDDYQQALSIVNEARGR